MRGAAQWAHYSVASRQRHDAPPCPLPHCCVAHHNINAWPNRKGATTTYFRSGGRHNAGITQNRFCPTGGLVGGLGVRASTASHVESRMTRYVYVCMMHRRLAWHGAKQVGRGADRADLGTGCADPCLPPAPGPGGMHTSTRAMREYSPVSTKMRSAG